MFLLQSIETWQQIYNSYVSYEIYQAPPEHFNVFEQYPCLLLRLELEIVKNSRLPQTSVTDEKLRVIYIFFENYFAFEKIVRISDNRWFVLWRSVGTLICWFFISSIPKSHCIFFFENPPIYYGVFQLEESCSNANEPKLALS